MSSFGHIPASYEMFPCYTETFYITSLFHILTANVYIPQRKFAILVRACKFHLQCIEDCGIWALQSTKQPRARTSNAVFTFSSEVYMNLCMNVVI